MLGQTLGHYRLSAEIGAGAMGKVYRATDLRLNRDVAVKVLPPDLLADAEARRRFRKEALTLSSADHPNIAVIFDFDTDAGTDFLVMELIPGESLSELLGRGPLPATEVASLGIQLADALDAAHRRNIIHRDIKPGNLRRTPDGRLKVLDFGIARRVAGSDDPTQTDSSMTTHAPGTLPYMAPEQLRGQVADARSDIYAAGVVLYEMATGRRLFTGRNAAEMIHAIVNEPVVSPRAIAPDIPEPVESVILKAIDKHADRRYQSAREMGIDLRRIVEPSVVARTPRPTSRMTRVALWVLPLAVVIAIAAIPSLPARVRRAFAPAPPPVEAAASPASTSSMLKAGMLPVRDLAHAGGSPWNDVIPALFSGELTGVAPQFGFVDPLSLMSLLRDTTSATSADPIAVRRILVSQGIELALEPVVMKASGGFDLRTTVVNPRTGENSFTTAVHFETEDGLPEAVHVIATRLVTYIGLQQGALSDKDVRPWISLRSQNIEAVKAFALANQYIFNYQPGEPEKHLRRAIDIDPEFIAARIWLISGLLGQRKLDEAKEQFAIVKKLEPKASPFEAAMIGYAGARIAGDLPAVARQLEMALQYSPGNNILIFNLAGTRAQLKDCDQALRLMRPLVDAAWQYGPLYSFWGVCAIRMHREDDARKGLERALQLPSVDPRVPAMLEALALARGDRAEADRQRQAAEARYRELHESPSAALIDVYEQLGEDARAKGHPDAAGALAARARQLRKELESPPERR